MDLVVIAWARSEVFAFNACCRFIILNYWYNSLFAGPTAAISMHFVNVFTTSFQVSRLVRFLKVLKAFGDTICHNFYKKRFRKSEIEGNYSTQETPSRKIGFGFVSRSCRACERAGEAKLCGV